MKNDKGLPCIIYRCPEKIDENKNVIKPELKE